MEKTCCSPRSTAKRTAILDAAQGCFLEHGYACTSMDMVASQAGVSKATIYAHFQSKAELFRAIIERRCDDLALGLGAVALDDAPNARAALTVIARHMLTMLTMPAVLGIYRIVVAESARDQEIARVYYEAGPLRGKARLATLLGSLHQRGLLNVPDPITAMDQFVGMLRGEYFNRLLLGLPATGQCNMDTTIAATVETLMRAYTPSPQAAQ